MKFNGIGYTLSSLINEHARLFFARKKIHPTRLLKGLGHKMAREKGRDVLTNS